MLRTNSLFVEATGALSVAAEDQPATDTLHYPDPETRQLQEVVVEVLPQRPVVFDIVRVVGEGSG